MHDGCKKSMYRTYTKFEIYEKRIKLFGHIIIMIITSNNDITQSSINTYSLHPSPLPNTNNLWLAVVVVCVHWKPIGFGRYSCAPVCNYNVRALLTSSFRGDFTRFESIALSRRLRTISGTETANKVCY